MIQQLLVTNIFKISLAKFISKRRAPVAKAIYAEMGGKSPILEETQAKQMQ